MHYADGTRVTLRSDGTWRSERAEWLPAPQRNNDVGDFVEWIDGRRHPTGWSEADFDDRDWSAAAVLGPVGIGALRRPLRPAHPDQRAPGERRRPCGRCPPARWWSTSARSTPEGRPCRSATGWTDTSSPCTWATPSIPTGRCPPPTTPRGPICPSPTPSGPAPRRSSPTSTSASATSRSTIPARRVTDGPGHPPGPSRDDARRRRGHLLLVGADARRGVGAVRPLGSLHVPGAVHRHAHPGEGPVPVGRGQRVRDGDADLRRTEPELAGAAGHGPGPGALLAHRPGQRGLPQRRRAPELPVVHRPLSRVGVALLPVHR